MILSLLDNDLYKFTMQYAVFKKFKDKVAEYKLILRKEVLFSNTFYNTFKKGLDHLYNLSFSNSELSYIKQQLNASSDYIDYLRSYKFDKKNVFFDLKNGNFELTIKGLWVDTILYEVPLMALISECYFDNKEITKYTISDKIDYINYGTFAEFGTRRRFSSHVQLNVIEHCCGHPNFIGTSNLHFAKLYNVNPIGTIAHEWYMAHGALYGYKEANTIAMNNWISVYNKLGLVLPDTFTTDKFLESYNKEYINLSDGVRQDSGDPVEFYNKIINHYEKNNIDLTTKKIMFSDALNLEKIANITKQCSGKINIGFGIGTYFTNDCGYTPLNMVIKLTKIDDKDCIKISDDTSKAIGIVKEISKCLEN